MLLLILFWVKLKVKTPQAQGLAGLIVQCMSSIREVIYTSQTKKTRFGALLTLIEGLRIRKGIKCPWTKDKKGRKTSFHMPKFGKLSRRICEFVWWSISGSYPERKLVRNSPLLSPLFAEKVRLVESRLSANQILQFVDQWSLRSKLNF